MSRVGGQSGMELMASEGVGIARGLEVRYIARIVNGGLKTGYDISWSPGDAACRNVGVGSMMGLPAK